MNMPRSRLQPALRRFVRYAKIALSLWKKRETKDGEARVRHEKTGGTGWGLGLLAAALLFLCACAKAGAGDAPPPVSTPEPVTELVLGAEDALGLDALCANGALKLLDLRARTLSAADYTALSEALPNCVIRWSAPLGDARYDSQAASLTLPEVPAELAEQLAFFPALRALEVESVSGAAACAALLEAVARYPACAFDWSVPLCGERYGQDVRQIDLSGKAAALPALKNALCGLPALEKLTLDEASLLTDDDKRALLAGFPNVQFVWDVALLPELLVRSDATELDLRGHTVDDVAAFAEKLTLLPALTRADMCGCGPSDEEMAGLRARFPAVKFIWLLKLAGWTIRTDIPGFSTGNINRFPNDMGRFDPEYERTHSAVTNELLKKLVYCTDLVALDIGHCKHVSDLSFLTELPKLQYLIFSRCAVADLTPVASQTELIYLEAGTNPVSDITPLRACSKLKYFHCGELDISEIETFSYMPALERLWVVASKLTDEQGETLRASLPNAMVVVHPDAQHAASLWRKGNQGYLDMQAIFGMRARNQG